MARAGYLRSAGRSVSFGGQGPATLLFFAELVGLLVLAVIWGLGRVFTGLSVAWAAWGGAGLLVAALLTLMAIHGVRAVAIETFHQCLRTKVAIVFILLLILSLAALPFLMEGDGTLAGRIRALLSWGTSITAALLGLVTIFLAASVVSFDVRDHQIFITATKPLARWQYLLGRWGGVVLLNTTLLLIAAAVIYGLAQYLREEPALDVPDGSDRRAVETEVFAARGKVHPLTQDLDEIVRQRIADLRDKTPDDYRRAIQEYMIPTGGDPDAAYRELVKEIRKQEEGKLKSRGYGEPFFWKFAGIHLQRSRIQGTGTVVQPLRGEGWMQIRADRSLLARMLLGSPVRIIGIDGIVGRVNRGSFYVEFRGQEDMHRRRLVNLKAGQKVDVVADPTIQISYKPMAAIGDLPVDDKRFHSKWYIRNPENGHTQTMDRKDPIRMAATLTVSARVVSSDGRTEVMCINNTHASLSIDRRSVAVRSAVGTFEWNYVRSVMLMMMQLMFLAAVGIFAGSFLSFPVASLVCFALLPFSLMREFLVDALKFPRSGRVPDVFTWLGHYALQLMKVLLPDFAGTSPNEAMVAGTYLPWTHVGETALLTVAVRSLLILGLGCLIFSRRELARVQM